MRGALLMSLRPSHLLQLMLLCVCSVFLLSLVFSAKVSASSSPITVTNQADTVHFPGSIDFTMTATDTAGSINHASIYIAYKDTVPNTITKQYSVSISKPAQIITLQWHENTGGDNFHSPGTPVEYFWSLQDTVSNQFSGPAQDFTTIDTRFSWQHQSQGLLQVNWYNRPQDFGQLLFKDANDSITRISSLLGNGLLHPINLWVYTSNQDFHGALAPGSYEWVGGEAQPALNEAFISVTDANDDTLVRDMPHELTHLVFHQLVDQGILPPTWFDEGLAVYNQSFHELEMKARFEQALRDHSLLRLDTITHQFPADADKAYLAYAQSWNLVGYMYSTFGQAKMTQLIKKMDDPQTSFDGDLTQALGEDEIHLENQWLVRLGQPGVLTPDQLTPTIKPVVQTSQPQSTLTDNTAPIFITAGTLLILLPIAGIVAIFVYQRRKRQQGQAVEAAQPFLTSNQFRLGSTPGYPGAARPMSSMQNPAYPSPHQPMQPVQNPAYPPPHQPMQPVQNPAYPPPQSPQTYIPFFPSTPERAFGVPPAQPPSTPSNPARGSWQPDFPATYREEHGEYGEPPMTPFGPFQENLNSQPKKKAPQE
jgi:hypothetical protein